MSGITIGSTAAQLVSDDTRKYFEDYYDGKIRMRCGEDCAEQCEIDHGYYKPAKYEQLFVFGDQSTETIEVIDGQEVHKILTFKGSSNG
jgi:hypothetical protein